MDMALYITVHGTPEFQYKFVSNHCIFMTQYRIHVKVTKPIPSTHVRSIDPMLG